MKKIMCKSCGENEATRVNEPCPFASEINGDYTPTDLCESCYEEACLDI